MDLKSEIKKAILELEKKEKIEEIKARILGKNGILTIAYKNLSKLVDEEKKQRGKELNQLKQDFQQALEKTKLKIQELKLKRELSASQLDISLEGRNVFKGGFHPIVIAQERIEKLFRSIGFEVTTGLEIESDYYNFEALNIPKDHPARQMSDTFYLSLNSKDRQDEALNVLRTHTSPIQIRFMEQNPPPIKIIAPGRVFRVDSDATHSPMFHQVEGLYVDKGVSFADLKFLMQDFIQKFFADRSLQTRFRPSFFPFTEPSAEIDIFDGSNWLEVGGCGLVHRKVLENVGIDPEIYTGFAFGIGIERLAMLLFGISDLRLFYENDMSFLQQFTL